MLNKKVISYILFYSSISVYTLLCDTYSYITKSYLNLIKHYKLLIFNSDIKFNWEKEDTTLKSAYKKTYEYIFCTIIERL